jgi:hypothetical protein
MTQAEIPGHAFHLVVASLWPLGRLSPFDSTFISLLAVVAS